jgi:hypothetical protein
VSAASEAIEDCERWVTTAYAELQAGDITAAAVHLAVAADIARKEAQR